MFDANNIFNIIHADTKYTVPKQKFHANNLRIFTTTFSA